MDLRLPECPGSEKKEKKQVIVEVEVEKTQVVIPKRPGRTLKRMGASSNLGEEQELSLRKGDRQLTSFSTSTRGRNRMGSGNRSLSISRR